jgi:hypothetical protein
MAMTNRRTTLLIRGAGTAAAALALSGGAYALAADDSSPRAAAAQSAPGAPSAFGRFADGVRNVEGVERDMLVLPLPPGSYLVLAKASVRQEAGRTMSCKLEVDADFDRTDIRSFGQPTRGAFTLTVLHHTPFPTTARLRCTGPSSRVGIPDINGSLRDIKLTAVELGGFENKPA